MLFSFLFLFFTCELDVAMIVYVNFSLRHAKDLIEECYGTDMFWFG